MSAGAFTQKHYVALAEVIRSADSLASLTDDLVALFLADNPRFSEDRFRKAAAK